MHNKKLEKYIPLVNFIGDACGKSFEVILHDVTDPENSVIAVKNGHLSGRKIGDSMTDLAMQVLNQNESQDKDYIASYEGRLKNGKIFVSSTYFIKDEDALIGMLCINYDSSLLLGISQQVANLLDSFNLSPNDNKEAYTEVLDGSISNMAENIIDATISNLNITPNRMTIKEKTQIIAELDKQDVFSAKGSVMHVAQALQISEPTVYRYLNKTRASKQ